jgi:hypothetical protein
LRGEFAGIAGRGGEDVADDDHGRLSLAGVRVHELPIEQLARIYSFPSTTHSQWDSPWSMFLVSLDVQFGFRLSTAPSPHL